MIPKANNNDIVVFILMPSPKNKYVKPANVIIPVENPINLLGHNSPLKCPTTSPVALISINEITDPITMATGQGFLLTQGQTN